MSTKYYQLPEEQNGPFRGVCCALARGWGVDPFWVKFLFGGLFVAGIFTAGISSFLVAVVYYAMALVMPTKEPEEKEE